jgi:transposase-like protein
VGTTQEQRDIKRKLAVLEYAKMSGNVAKTCRRFGISRQCFYNWLRAFERRGEAGLINRGPCPENHALRTPRPIEEKIVHLRLTYHVEDQGLRHASVKPASPNLNGTVERSHLTDKLESYQFLEYTDDVDPAEKPAAWEESYNVHRPHGGLAGLTPYEILHEKMTAWNPGQARSGRSQLQLRLAAGEGACTQERAASEALVRVSRRPQQHVVTPHDRPAVLQRDESDLVAPRDKVLSEGRDLLLEAISRSTLKTDAAGTYQTDPHRCSTGGESTDNVSRAASESVANVPPDLPTKAKNSSKSKKRAEIESRVGR